LKRAIQELEKVKQEDYPKLKAVDYHDLMKALGVRSHAGLGRGGFEKASFAEKRVEALWYGRIIP